MKKLNKIVLDKAKEMTPPEMKNITGGGDGPPCWGAYLCTCHYWIGNQSYVDYGCSDSAADCNEDF